MDHFSTYSFTHLLYQIREADVPKINFISGIITEEKTFYSKQEYSQLLTEISKRLSQMRP